MLCRLLLLTLFCAGTSSASGQVRIHDVAVRLLAKPYGIEKRIELQSIDEIHSSSDGTKRLAFTLRSSGVKEVILNKPNFAVDIVMPDGNWASLGALSGCGITFPLTGKSTKESHSYVAEFKSHLSGSDIAAYLRRAASSRARIRLLGHAELVVRSENRTGFRKPNLKLELGGRTTLCGDFEAVAYPSTRLLPKVGKR